ncbi:hypothetical protein [Acetobacter okinawensis]|uniref:Uncharacterized protein n=1 Tax=Acetobacter okinawensis TaxID=1076594 RepID=A0A252BRD1_9PROT|nr:hypothetical protein [Acetobacter okinawensis]OUJ10149.1 hypothetical protein HK26_11600 [Acetobacter okinawensis]
MSLTSQKPTGVFVRLPLSNEQLGKLLIPTRTFNERMISIGTPVTGGELRVSAFADYIPPSAIGVMAQIFEVSDRRTKSFNEPLVRHSDAQAQIAALEAEVVHLREDMDASKRKNFNAGYLIACCNIYNLHNEEGIAADILREAGITEAEVKALDLNEYDAEALAVIRGAGNDDPILKGGAA